MDQVKQIIIKLKHCVRPMSRDQMQPPSK